MTDIATLGLKIDSTDATVAASNLDKLSAAGAKADAAAAKLGATHMAGGAQAADYSKKAQSVADSIALQTAKAEMGGREFAAFAAVQKAGVPASSAMGLAVSAAAGNLFDLQHAGENAGESLSNQRVKFKALGEAAALAGGPLGGLIQQTGFLTIGSQHLSVAMIAETAAIGAVVAGAVKYLSISKELAGTKALGQLTGFGNSGIQGLQNTASNNGIDGKDLAAAMTAFNALIPTAKTGVGALGDLLRVNKVTVDGTSDAFFKVADLVKNAASDTARMSILQQAGLPATREFVNLMSQGSATLKQMISDAPKLSDAQIEQAEKVEKKYNQLATSFTTTWKSAIVDVTDGWIDAWNRPFMDPSTLVGGWLENLKTKFKQELHDPVGGDLHAVPTIPVTAGGSLSSAIPAAKTSVDAATEKAIAQDRISKAQQYLGLLGSTTTAMEAQRAVQLQADAAALNGVGVTKERLAVLKQLAVETNLGITTIKASTDAAKVDAATVGMSVGQTAAYTAAQNALNEAKRNGKILTGDDVAAIQKEADALGVAAQHADDMKFAYTNLVSGPMQTLNTQLQQGASFFDALNQAGRSALNSISSKLIDMATQKLWLNAFGGAAGGGSGFLSSLFSGWGGSGSGASGAAGSAAAAGGVAAVHHTGYGPGDSFPTRYVHPAYFDDAPRFHTGIGPGERAAVIQDTESVLTKGQMGALAPAGSGDVQVNVFNAPAGTNATTTQTKMPNGGARIDVTLQRHIDDTTATGISSGESATNKALEQRYGLVPRL